MLTREAIVAAARRQVEGHGFETVSLRAVARELDVTAPALYDHVDSKSDLLALIAAEGFEEMVAEFGIIDASAATERLRARAVAYVAFAVNHPELFRLMFQYRPIRYHRGCRPRPIARPRRCRVVDDAVVGRSRRGHGGHDDVDHGA